MSEGIEHMKREREYPNGFSSVAAFIAKDPDKTSTIYRRFDRLSARNLLFLQSRLQKLETLQDLLDQETLLSDNTEAAKAASSWEDFEWLAKTNDSEKMRMELAIEIEKTLGVYHQALLLHSKLLKLKSPAQRTLKAYKKWFKPEEGNTKLRGYSNRILDEEDDLLALRVPAAQDRFTSLLQSCVPWLFVVGSPGAEPWHRGTEADSAQSDALDDGVVLISEHGVARFVAIFSTFLAAILLIGAMVALNYVDTQNLKIIIITSFTVMFAGSVSLFTSSGRTEVFAATAAYAAVLVVFMNGNPTNYGSGSS